ncbi:hypothetical protein Q1695_007701 [Nippostrongylus brasiliensis]|nr:hypothetical protein Q1695_007701 [Nippostrongylus brasiliensis]
MRLLSIVAITVIIAQDAAPLQTSEGGYEAAEANQPPPPPMSSNGGDQLAYAAHDTPQALSDSGRGGGRGRENDSSNKGRNSGKNNDKPNNNKGNKKDVS